MNINEENTTVIKETIINKTISLTEDELNQKLLIAGMTKIKEIQNDLSMMGLMLAKGTNGRWQARKFND